jgi:hypothetical protein
VYFENKNKVCILGRSMLGHQRASLLATAALALTCVGLSSADEDAGPDFYDLKCSACCSIVAELERNLEVCEHRVSRLVCCADRSLGT